MLVNVLVVVITYYHCYYNLIGVSSQLHWIMLIQLCNGKEHWKICIGNFTKLFMQFTFVTWQADYKLSYALKHCNPRNEANIRFGSGVPTVYVAFAWSGFIIGRIYFACSYTCTVNIHVFADGILLSAFS